MYYNKKVEFTNVNQLIPDIYVSSNEQLQNVPFPRILKSHEPYNPKYKKVIYIVRDVRDVSISYYYHSLKHRQQRQDLDFNAFLTSFINGKIWPGLWSNHVIGWLNQKEKIENGFLLIKYENLLKNTHEETKKIIEFLNIKRSDEQINDAITWASFNNMRSIENKQRWGNSTIPFIRSGKTGQWKNFLNQEQKNKLHKQFEKTLIRLNY